MDKASKGLRESLRAASASRHPAETADVTASARPESKSRTVKRSCCLLRAVEEEWGWKEMLKCGPEAEKRGQIKRNKPEIPPCGPACGSTVNSLAHQHVGASAAKLLTRFTPKTSFFEKVSVYFWISDVWRFGGCTSVFFQ